VFEEILTWPGDDDYRQTLVLHLQRDGYSIDDRGRIRGGSVAAFAEIPLDQLSDPSSIYEHLERSARFGPVPMSRDITSARSEGFEPPTF
jgi:hypothetical protein